MVKYFTNAQRKFFAYISGEHAKANRIIMLGWVAITCHPIYYLMWTYIFPQKYENVTLRVIGICVAIPLLFAEKNYEKKWFDVVFFICLTFNLPFFFSFMLLMNDGSLVWSNSLLITIIVLFHFGTKFAMAAMATGFALAYVFLVFLTGHVGIPNQDIFSLFPIIIFSIVSVTVVKISRDILIDEKLKGMATAMSVVAHELRTPLISVGASARGLDRLLPSLIKFYKENSAFNSEVLPVGRENMIMPATARIQTEVTYMNNAIDMLLNNAGDTKRKAQIREKFSIERLVCDALNRYPFESEEQRALVSTDFRTDFVVDGNLDLCTMIIFNLLKNSLRAIAKAHKGSISIITENIGGTNQLIFTDTGCGIPMGQLPHIFKKFYSYPTSEGSGIGLSFVRDTLNLWGGRITCKSIEMEYSEFIIEFKNSDARPENEKLRFNE